MVFVTAFIFFSIFLIQKEKRADQRIRREAQVTLYRSYRVGDLPDIQIQYSSLIAPLQALAQVRAGPDTLNISATCHLVLSKVMIFL